MQADVLDQPRHRIDYVDGLRAIAVLAVVLAHVAYHGLAPGTPQRFMLEGSHGVDLFFVISGFCLAFPRLAKLRNGKDVAFDVGDYFTKRLVRIVPPYYIATAAFLAMLVVPHLIAHHALPTGLPDARSLAMSLLFLDDRVTLLNSSFWTLMVEFRWYFLFPVMLWLWVRSPRAFMLVGIVSLLLYHFTRARDLDLGTLPGFMLGIVAADLQLAGTRTHRWGPHLRRWAWALVVPAALIGIAMEPWATIPGFYRADVAFAYQPTIFAWQIACFAFVVAAGAVPAFSRLLSLRALVAIGVASYAIYLVHEPIIAYAANHPGLAANVLGAVAALAIGFAFWAVVERPFTTGPLRAPCLDAVRPIVTGVLAWAQVGRLKLSAPSSDARESSEVRVAERVGRPAPAQVG